MTIPSPLRCILIGSDSLLVQCGEILLREGHSLTHIVTDQERIADWARSQSLDVIDATTDFSTQLQNSEFDCLFSITWLSILSDDVLALPKLHAINFHDGPLPAYAGLYTPAWAIKNSEARYGVTWHSMVSGVDRGDILEQEHFDIAERETSLTINTRCFEAGVASFERLLGNLVSGELATRPQNTDGRSYFAKHQRPQAACDLDWSKPAAELDALVRALDFGRYPNPLGTAKLHCNGEVLSVTSAQLENASGDPGTVLETTDRAIVVATGSGALALTGFAYSCGAALSPADLAARWSLAPGAKLDSLNSDQRARLSALNGELAKHETFWATRLGALEPLELPWAEAHGPASHRQRKQLAVNLPSEFAGRFAGTEFRAATIAAISTYLSRIGSKEHFHLGFRSAASAGPEREFSAWIAPVVPLLCETALDSDFANATHKAAQELDQLQRRKTWIRDALGRFPALRDQPELARGPILPLEVVFTNTDFDFDEKFAPALSFLVAEGSQQLSLSFDNAAISAESVERLARQLETWLASVANSTDSLATLALLPQAELEKVLYEWNATEVDFARDSCVQQLFAQQAQRTPDAIALACNDKELTFAEFDQRANQLARHLIELGIGPDMMVGVHVERSVDLMVAVMGVLKSGGAYLPLDPDFPADRIAFMVEDARASVIVTQDSLAKSLPKSTATIVSVYGDHAKISEQSASTPEVAIASDQLAYAIYTSGSTGLPKGVLVEHRNVGNFFAGMDERVRIVEGGVWLAVTSLSFDISVLELLWTACRGFKTVIYGGLRQDSQPNEAALDFGLSFFASNRDESAATQYEFLLDSARFADSHEFASIWTPERHFHAFGGLYPNPSVTSAALAAITKNIQIRCGSVVVALHHPIRIAEEWSLVDNLSQGRVGISIASGWHPNDFVLAPEAYADRKELMVSNMELVRELWRGNSVPFKGPNGEEVQTSIMPKPVQSELPLWVTAAGNPETFRQAGELGANVLTHLLGQSTEELAQKLEVYHEAWRQAGHAGRGRVTIMLHTFIGEDVDEVREIVRAPMREYLRSAVDLIKNHVSSWSAVKKSVDGGKAPEIGSLDDLPQEDIEALLNYSFERYFESSALFGTPESTLPLLENLHSIGIDEITCLVDFGVPCQTVLESLPKLNALRVRINEILGPVATPTESLDQLITRHNVTHMQCTPSMASILVEDEPTAKALETLDVMMVGGEPFPPELAKRLASLVHGRVINMYGPTETTIWSSTCEVSHDLERMTIGTPIANTQLYILDADLQPMPVGVSGELYIGGDGVTRGYHERVELTADRFVPNPFRTGERMYRTGDVARWLSTGEVDFQGRVDHQVKVRGYRIELGEIEAGLENHEHVSRAIVVPREANGATQLAAFVIASENSSLTAPKLAEHLAKGLPEYMVPESFEFVASFPLTPNKKVDRKALAASKLEAQEPERVAAPAPKAAPTVVGQSGFDLSATIDTLLAIWKEVLGTENCGPDENFFDLGGHSLLTIRVQKAIREELDINVPLVDMFRFTTVRTLAGHLAPKPVATSDVQTPSKASQRAAKRRRRAS